MSDRKPTHNRKIGHKFRTRSVVSSTIVFLVLMIFPLKLVLSDRHPVIPIDAVPNHLHPPVRLKALYGTSPSLPKIAVDWPKTGQAALMMNGQLYGHHGQNSPVPIASLTKMMTALIVLQKYPLSSGESGPTYTVTRQDVALYDSEFKQNDSVVKVSLGETLTERQMLEGLLLPSGDNMAVMLANWVSGSVPNFVTQMNSEAKRLGLAHTNYADPAGVSQHTVSTALSQLKIAAKVMANPVLKQIVSQESITYPVVGTLKNTNFDLGQDGIIGVKTGNLTHIGNMAVAAYRTIAQQRMLVIGVVLGQYGQNDWGSLTAGLNAGKQMIASVK